MTVNKLLLDTLRSGEFPQASAQDRKETMAVNQPRIQLLIDALRSGEFPQAHGVLCALSEDGTVRGYCCLGIATEVARRNGLAVTVYEGSFRIYGGEGAVLPRAVMEWYGLGSDDPSLRYGDDGYHTATELNDTLRLTLPEIGDAFERTFLTGP